MDDFQEADVEVQRSGVRVDRSNKRLCSSLHSPSSLLLEAEHSKLEDNTGLPVRGIWYGRYGNQLGPGYNQNHPKYTANSFELIRNMTADSSR